MAVGNTWGHLFRVTTWGESHGAALGAIVDGCPPRLALSEADIQPDLDRRVPGQSALVTQRKETDRSRSSPACSKARRSARRSPLHPQPGHAAGRLPRGAAEVPAEPRGLHLRRQVRHPRLAGGGRTSARETAGRVAAGAVARKLLTERFRVTVVAWVSKVGTLTVDCDPER